LQVRVVATETAMHFLECETEMPEDITVYRDKDEWSTWNKRGDPVLHIDLMKWADMLVIAPTSANSLAKIANVSIFCCHIYY
jgi:phosphopantothenoylcysteine decarboxylase